MMLISQEEIAHKCFWVSLQWQINGIKLGTNLI